MADFPALIANAGRAGAIPPSTSALTALRELELDHNRLTGRIPASMGSMTQLESLTLNDNVLTGVDDPAFL